MRRQETAVLSTRRQDQIPEHRTFGDSTSHGSRSQKNRISLPMSLFIATLVLVVSRSVLAPHIISVYAPAIAFAVLIFGSSTQILNFRLDRKLVFVLILAVVFAVSTVIRGDFGLILTAACMASMWIAVFLVSSNMRSGEWKAFVRLFLVLCLMQAALAVLETVLQSTYVREYVTAAIDRGYPLRPNTILGDWTNRAQGTMGYPIPFGHMLSIGTALLLTPQFVQSAKIRVSLALLFVGAILLSGTRTALIAVVVVALVTWLLLAKRKRSIPTYAFILMFLPVISLIMWNILDASTLTTDTSFLHRFGVLESVVAIFSLGALQILVGGGYNSHVDLFMGGLIEAHGTFAVDNAFITFLITSGCLGLGAVIAALLKAFRHAQRDTLAVLLIFVVFGMSYDFQNWHALMFLFCAFLGHALSVVRVRSLV